MVGLVLPRLGEGGAQRTFLNIVNNLDRSRFEPVLILYHLEGTYLPLLRKDVQVVHLQCAGTRSSIPRLARWMRRARPDLVMSTILHINAATVIAGKLAGGSTRVIVRETNNFTAAGRPLHSFSGQVVGCSYRRADAVVALSKGVREDLLRRYVVDPRLVHTIYNPIDIEHVRAMSLEGAPDIAGWTESKVLKIVGVGKLERQKGFDLLIEALARMKLRCSLLILGSGTDRDRLRDLSVRMGVVDRVRFGGFQHNPHRYVAQADLFVLSSRWEGFGHVITEAMAVGTPVLATRCPSGPDEIITDDVDGRLCQPGSAVALADQIESLLKDPGARARYARAARDSVGRFDVSVVVPQYESLFQGVVEA